MSFEGFRLVRGKILGGERPLKVDGPTILPYVLSARNKESFNYFSPIYLNN